MCTICCTGPLQQFDFGRQGGQWDVNGVVWQDTINRILANPQRDGLELWKVKVR